VTTKQIVAAALKLPLTKRADLASRLIRSLEEDEEKLSPQERERLWTEEAERRLEEMREGKVEEIRLEAALADARALLD
jgi:hypothetical protein